MHRLLFLIGLAQLLQPAIALGEPSRGRAGLEDGPVAVTRACPAPRPLRCFDGVEKLQIRPWGLAVEGSGAFGYFAGHGNLRLGIGRRFWERLELELSAQLMVGERFQGVAESVRLGLLFHLTSRMELLAGWRIGYAHFHVELPVQNVWAGAGLIAVMLEMKLALTPALELRLAPFVATGYWNEIWGFVVEPTAGLAYRF